MLTLSLFPGIGLLDRGFEEAGYCVVRGPDLIFGGDIFTFHAPPGKFDLVMGGPPCQKISGGNWNRDIQAGMELVNEFVRVVQEARPQCWLMENVGGIPDVKIPGYSWQRIDLRANEFGLKQNRLRFIQFGHRDNLVLTVPRDRTVPATERCCMASEGNKSTRRGWADFCELQGLPRDFDLPAFTQSEKYRAVGNGVPVPMARALAEGILNLREGARVCVCGCGREVMGKSSAAAAGPTCRKRLERRRKCDAPE